jgi:monoterpene epsilon-lactone hydrolase
LYLRKYGLAMPGSAVLVSPFVDLVDDFVGNEEYLNLDFLNPEPLAMVQYQYTENRPDLKDSLLSPSRNKLPDGYTFVGFPRAFISYGEVEMFRPSIIRLIEILRNAGVKVQVDKGKDQVHDYPTYTKDRSVDGFFGQLKPFLEDHGQYEEAFVLV